MGEYYPGSRWFDRFEPFRLIDMRTPFVKCENDPCKQISNWMAVVKKADSRHVRFILSHILHGGVCWVCVCACVFVPNIINRFAALPQKMPENKGNASIGRRRQHHRYQRSYIAQIELKSVPKCWFGINLAFSIWCAVRATSFCNWWASTFMVAFFSFHRHVAYRM